MAIIQTKQLTKYYGKVRGIESLDLTVEEGDLFGFIGPNGAGKSTTIRILMGLIRPTSGSVKILGLGSGSNREAILAQTGYMPSEAMFYTGMKVGEIIRMSAALYHKDCRQEAKRLCRKLELDCAKRVEELSLGNRKKVSIVCALQTQPKLLILDEPSSGLDPLMQKVFFEILEERRRQGATVFLSSHVLSEIQRYCNRAAIVRQGRIIVSDRVENLARTQARRVTLRGTTEAPSLAGVKDVQTAEQSVSFLYQGSVPALLHNLANRPLTDITITEPDLEEIFFHYYAGSSETSRDEEASL